MEICRVRQIGQEVALNKASIADYVEKVSREFRQADKDTQVHELAYPIGAIMAHVMQRLDSLGKLASELSSATVNSFGKNDPIVKED